VSALTSPTLDVAASAARRPGCLTLARTEDSGYDAFVEVARRAYDANPSLIPSSELATARALSGRGPRAGRADWRMFVIPRRARAVAILNRELSPDVSLGQLGYFEAVDEESGRRVATDALQWLRSRGCTRAVGPMEFDIYGRYRWKTAHFETAPHVAEPHNPPLYPALFQSLGFAPRHRWYSAEVAAGETARFLEAPLAAHAEALAGYRVRPLATEQMESELRNLHELVTRSFFRFHLYSGLTWDNFLAVFSPWRPLWDPKLVLFAEGPDGAPAGFAMALPDVGRRLRAMRGRTGLVARARYVLTRADRDRCVALYLGRKPGTPHGLGLLLTHALDTQAQALGYRTTVHALIAEDNAARRYAPAAARRSGEYALYERSLL
jgi:hypothetical protein